MLSNADFRQFLKRPRAPEEPSSSHPPSTTHEPEQRRFPADFATQQHAADVLRSLARDGRTDVASLRGAPALADVPPKLRSAVFAITSEVLKQLASLRRALAAAAFSVDDDLSTDATAEALGEIGVWSATRGPPPASDGLRASLAVVLLHDLLVSRRWLDRRQEAVRRLLSQQDRLRAAFESAAAAPAPAAYLTFYLVNTLRRSVDEVVNALTADGWTELSPLGATAKTSAVAAPRPASAPPAFCRDALFDGVLAFPPALRELRTHRLVADGSLLPMDRASAAAALALAPRPGSVVIDACAAPGKKTLKLCALMRNAGELHAFDADAARARDLEANLARLGASCAVVRHGDFLEVDPTLQRWLDVEFIQLDPSCSGSGTTFHHRRDADVYDLASSQFKLLAHAGRFPGARRIVYSTCSTLDEENEFVVAKAALLLGTIGWALTHALPTWPRRGKAVAGLSAGDAERCARFDPDEDLCLGFFVAVFERGPRRLELG